MSTSKLRGAEAAGTVAVRVRGLRKAYGGRPAVDGLDLDIVRGEVFALLGPNGAGKTTTVEILEGYLDVALGIVGRPELLFLDEPTTGFDPQARRAFWDLVAGLKDDGTTILLTTHYLDEAQHLADRVGVIAAGRLLALDTPERLGGREAHHARVRWVDDAGPHEESTQSPTRLVAELARRYDGEVPGLEVVRPSLEDVYLGLIGAPEDNVATGIVTTEDVTA